MWRPTGWVLRSASRWYEPQRDGLGHALIDEFEERLAQALEHPHAGTIVGSTTQGLPIRRHRLARFARYSILMFVDEDGTATVLPSVIAPAIRSTGRVGFANEFGAALGSGRALAKKEPGRSGVRWRPQGGLNPPRSCEATCLGEGLSRWRSAIG